MNFNPVLLKFDRGQWGSLMAHLAREGGGERESGAFLLGKRTPNFRSVARWLPYEVLDPESLNFDFVRLGPQAFTRLWAHCAELGLEIVADIHTHPLGPRQSYSDRAYPMVAIPGHVALIAPHFALGTIRPDEVSVNCYLGNGRWQSYLGAAAASRIHLEESTDER